VANADGGWGFAPGTASDADSTGAALQALAAAGGSRGAIRAGVNWLRGAQGAGGGFALAGGAVNAQSTAWAVQGLIAAGASPRAVRSGGDSPLDYLASVQAGDGHYRYSRSLDQTPVWVTGQALQAASGQALPLRRVSPSGKKATKAAKPVAGAGAEVAPTGTGKAGTAGKGAAVGAGGVKPAKPKPGAQPQQQAEPEAEVQTLEPTSDSGAESDDDSALPELAAAVLALLAVLGGAWMLRRQRVPGSRA
jgi:hypothetical protein